MISADLALLAPRCSRAALIFFKELDIGPDLVSDHGREELTGALLAHQLYPLQYFADGEQG